MSVNRDQVFTGCEQAADIALVSGVGNLNARCVDDHVCIDVKDFLDGAGRDDTRRRPARNLSRIPASFFSPYTKTPANSRSGWSMTARRQVLPIAPVAH